MQIVIDIDENIYRRLKSGNYGLLVSNTCAYEVLNGTPLPKGHGRLIDISEYENNYFNVSISYDDGNHIHEIYTREIPAIIEADKGDKE